MAGGGFLKIENTGKTADRLLGASTTGGLLTTWNCTP